MFGNIHSKKVVGYSFADPQEPRVIFEREEAISFMLLKDTNKYLVFSKSELEKQIKNLPKQIEDTNTRGLSPALSMLSTRLEFAKTIVNNFEIIAARESDALISRERIVLAPDISEEDKTEAIEAVREHTQQAAQKEIENLPDPYDLFRFLGFIIDGQLCTVFSKFSYSENKPIREIFNKEGLIELSDSYYQARDIYSTAYPDQDNPYKATTYILGEVLEVLNYFEGKHEDAERFCDAVCFMNGSWVVDEGFYQDSSGRPLLKLHIDCQRKQFTLNLDVSQIEGFMGELNALQEKFSDNVFNRITSDSFKQASQILSSKVLLIKSDVLNLDKLSILDRSDVPSFAL